MRSNKGFTLIELLIVVVIIGILAAIAIPKFAATKDRAYVATMESDLRNLATYEEQYAADSNGKYFGGTATNAAPIQGFTPSKHVTQRTRCRERHAPMQQALSSAYKAGTRHLMKGSRSRAATA
jgi:type IV pilus assembly protein PilA